MGVSLVLLAAGLGRRFGGDKQVTAVGPAGGWVIEYTLYDAWRSGIRRAVIIVNQAVEHLVREHISDRWGERMDLHYVLQQTPPGLPAREKPWGTGQAVLSAASLLADAPFIVANGDDFYGGQAIAILRDYLEKGDDQAMVGYRIASTLSPQGGVSRALCRVDDNGYLSRLEERHGIHRRSDARIVDRDGLLFADQQLISMNLFGLQAEVLPLLAQQFDHFAARAAADDEFYLPVALGELIQQGLKLKVFSTSEQWYGVTYAQDQQVVREALIQLGERYPGL